MPTKPINIWRCERIELLREKVRVIQMVSMLQNRPVSRESVTESARRKYQKKQELKPALKRLRQIELRLKVMTNG